MNSFKTPKGTTLPLLDLKGKSYLQVAHRLVWFREDHQDWSITTSVTYNDTVSVARAEIKDNSGHTIATAHKRETADGFFDFIEKSETGAIGRALALCGYGTQFTDDLEEGERLADSPVSRNTPPVVGTSGAPKPSPVANPPSTGGVKKFIADPSKKASPAQVGRLFKLCEVHGWVPTQAQDLVKNKYGHERFMELNQTEYDWVCEKIQTTTFNDAMKEAVSDTKKWLEANKPSSLFDEMNPPPMTDEDVPF